MSPVKEPNYFASEIRLGNVGSQWQDWAQRENDSLQRYLHGPMQEKRFGGIVSSWSDYLKPFQNVRGHGSHKGRPDSSASAKSGKSQGLARGNQPMSPVSGGAFVAGPGASLLTCRYKLICLSA